MRTPDDDEDMRSLGALKFDPWFETIKYFEDIIYIITIFINQNK